MSTFYQNKLMDFVSIRTGSSFTYQSASVLYTNPSNTSSYVSEIEIHNSNVSSSLSASVMLYLVPSNGGSVGSSSLTNQFMWISLAATETIWNEPKFPYILSSGNDTVMGISSISGVNINLRGSQYY